MISPFACFCVTLVCTRSSDSLFSEGVKTGQNGGRICSTVKGFLASFSAEHREDCVQAISQASKGNSIQTLVSYPLFLLQAFTFSGAGVCVWNKHPKYSSLQGDLAPLTWMMVYKFPALIPGRIRDSFYWFFLSKPHAHKRRVVHACHWHMETWILNLVLCSLYKQWFLKNCG